jgi:hypothetical protein
MRKVKFLITALVVLVSLFGGAAIQYYLGPQRSAYSIHEQSLLAEKQAQENLNRYMSTVRLVTSILPDSWHSLSDNVIEFSLYIKNESTAAIAPACNVTLLGETPLHNALISGSSFHVSDGHNVWGLIPPGQVDVVKESAGVVGSSLDYSAKHANVVCRAFS